MKSTGHKEFRPVLRSTTRFERVMDWTFEHPVWFWSSFYLAATVLAYIALSIAGVGK